MVKPMPTLRTARLPPNSWVGLMVASVKRSAWPGVPSAVSQMTRAPVRARPFSTSSDSSVPSAATRPLDWSGL